MNNLDDILPRIEAADPDRLRASKLADAKGREALAWIYAFHLELAKVPEMVSEPMIGEIRYQWWRKAVNEIYTGNPVRAHEVSTPLASVLLEHDIPRFWVDRLIDGRNRDLDPAPFSDIDDAREYCQKTSGVLMQIAAKCLGGENELVLAAGEAWGLTGLARGYGYYHDRMLSNLNFEEILEAASAAYSEAKRGKLEAAILPACAYAALAPLFLKRMSAPKFDPKSHVAVISPFAKQWRQFQTVIKGHL